MNDSNIGKIMSFLLVIGTVIIIAILSLSTIPKAESETVIPAAMGYVVDDAGVLTFDQVTALTDRLDDHDPEMGVLVVKTLQGLDIRDYGIKVADSWKVGDDELDNGLIIILATEDRKVGIEVGQGLEGDITDAEAGEIIDQCMLGALAEGKWFEGIDAGISCINNKLAK